MKRVRMALAVFVIYLAVAVGISGLVPGKGHTQNPPPTFNVKVANTPLQVAGSVSSTVTGDVNAKQSGAWDIGITGTPNVNVANTPTIDAQQKGAWSVGIQGTPTVSTGLESKLDTANGHLAGIRGQTDKLAFDGSGSLKVAPQGTQNVNVVGGDVGGGLAPATRGAVVEGEVNAQQGARFFVPGGIINASTIHVGTSGGGFDVTLEGPNGIKLFVPHVDGEALHTLTQRIPVNSVYVFCTNWTFKAFVRVQFVGD